MRARTSVDHLTNRAMALRSTGGPGEELRILLNLNDQPYDFPTGDRVEAHSWKVC